MEMNEFPNYKSARILGLCLNTMGLIPKKDNLTRKYHALHKTIINWVINNFQNITAEYPDIAATCLQGNVSYDKEKNQLIYSHISGMKRELKKITLRLIIKIETQFTNMVET